MRELHQYTAGFYQEVREEPPGVVSTAEGLAMGGGALRLVGKAVLAVAGNLERTQMGPIYLVFNTLGWPVEYELRTRALEDLPPSQRYSTRFYFRSLPENVTFHSPEDLATIVQSHLNQFGGTQKQSRMGPMVEYSKDLDPVIRENMLLDYRRREEHYGQRAIVLDVLRDLGLDTLVAQTR